MKTRLIGFTLVIGVLIALAFSTIEVQPPEAPKSVTPTDNSFKDLKIN
jgi:hypothetical protein